MLIKRRQTEHKESVLWTVSNYRSSALWMMMLKKKKKDEYERFSIRLCDCLEGGGHHLVDVTLLLKVPTEVNVESTKKWMLILFHLNNWNTPTDLLTIPLIMYGSLIWVLTRYSIFQPISNSAVQVLIWLWCLECMQFKLQLIFHWTVWRWDLLVVRAGAEYTWVSKVITHLPHTTVSLIVPMALLKVTGQISSL